MLVAHDRAAADRVRRARLSVRLGLEGLPADRRGLRHRAAGRTARVGPPAASRSSRRRPRPTAATTSTSARREAAALVGRRRSSRALRDADARALRGGAPRTPSSCGIIVADTKFEFGLRRRRRQPASLILIDEVLTPDSSRFWPADGYAPGGAAAELRQAVRPRLPRAINWNKQPPVPSLPDDVVAKTREKYLEAFRPPDRPGTRSA